MSRVYKVKNFRTIQRFFAITKLKRPKSSKLKMYEI
jgi:hypothetical protein